tara:strand:+ start:867 stop:995 length:129 start_codon:yes stop_codon:yes gene_type:complete
MIPAPDLLALAKSVKRLVAVVNDLYVAVGKTLRGTAAKDEKR